MKLDPCLPHEVSIRPDLQLTSVRVSLQSNGMCEGPDSAVLIFPVNIQLIPSGSEPNSPDRTGHTRDTKLLRDLGFVHLYLRQLSGLLIELHRPSATFPSIDFAIRVRKHVHDGVNIDIASKVPRQVAEVSTLLNDRTHIDSLVPPSRLFDSFVCA